MGSRTEVSLPHASVGFLMRYDGELREPLVWRQGSQVSTLAYTVSASNTLDQLGLDPGSSLEISYRA